MEPVTFDDSTHEQLPDAPLPNIAATAASNAATPSNAVAAPPTVTNGAVAPGAATTTSNFGSPF